MTFFLLGAYATGVAMVHFTAPWPWSVYCALAISLVICWLILQPRSSAWLPCFGLLFLCGLVNTFLHMNPPAGQNHVAHFTDHQEYAIAGTLLSVEQREPEGYRLFVDVHLIAYQQREAQVSGKVLLYIKQGNFTARSGQVIRWRSRLRRPTRFGNPGEFDYPLHLAAQGIYVTAFLKQAEDLTVIVNHPMTSNHLLENMRQRMAKRIEASVPEQTVGLLQALLLGKRDLVSRQQREAIAASGVAHLFAISGLHFGLLALLLYHVGKWFYTRSRHLMLWCPPQRILPLLLLIPLFAYLLFTGNAWATRRAFLMVSLVAMLLTYSRRPPPMTLLATTALIILVCNPLALFQPGFQLSFSGVAGILVWVPAWQRLPQPRNRLCRGLILLTLTTAAATLATAPATLWHFHQFAPAGLLANLVALPLVAWGSVPLGIVSLALSSLAPDLGEVGLQCSGLLVEWAMSWATKTSQFPGFKVILHYLTATQLVLLLGTLAVLVPCKTGSRRTITLCICSIVLCMCMLTYSPAEGLRVTALSVGQGDATLISFDDKHYLVDGGGLPGSSIDTGSRIVGPALGRLGVTELAGVLLTHNHPDHSSGLAYVIDRLPVKAFYSALSPTELADNLLNTLQNRSTPIITLAEGWTEITVTGDQTLHFFTPAQTSRNLNERSVAVYTEVDDNGLLLTADLGKPGLEQLLAADLPGRVSLLKLPHHGSQHAYPGSYLDALHPEMTFVSAGRNNVYGFPHESTLQACAEHDVPPHRTDHSGMLTFLLHNEKWTVKGLLN